MAPIYPSPNQKNKQHIQRKKQTSPQRIHFRNFNSSRWKWPANNRKEGSETSTLVSPVLTALDKTQPMMSMLELARMCKRSCALNLEASVLPGMDQFRDFGTVQKINRIKMRQLIMGKASPCMTLLVLNFKPKSSFERLSKEKIVRIGICQLRACSKCLDHLGIKTLRTECRAQTPSRVSQLRACSKCPDLLGISKLRTECRALTLGRASQLGACNKCLDLLGINTLRTGCRALNLSRVSQLRLPKVAINMDILLTNQDLKVILQK